MPSWSDEEAHNLLVKLQGHRVISARPWADLRAYDIRLQASEVCVTAALTHGKTDDLDHLFSDASTIRHGSFDGIYRHYKPALTQFAKKEGASDPEGVADLALFDGFKVAVRMHTPKEASFRSYVYRAARSHIVAERRQSTVPIDRHEEPEEKAALEPGDLNDKLWLDSLLAELTVDQRNVIRCRFLLDMSSAATAEMLDKTPNSVDQLQHRAVKRLRHLVFSGIILAIFAAGIWMLLTLSAGNGTVDKRPIDGPVRPQPEQNETQTVEAGDPQFADDTPPLRLDSPQSISPTKQPVDTTMPTAEIGNDDTDWRDPTTIASKTPTPAPAATAVQISTSAITTTWKVAADPDPMPAPPTKYEAKADRKMERSEAQLAKLSAKKKAADPEKSTKAEEKFLQRVNKISAKARKKDQPKDE